MVQTWGGFPFSRRGGRQLPLDWGRGRVGGTVRGKKCVLSRPTPRWTPDALISIKNIPKYPLLLPIPLSSHLPPILLPPETSLNDP